MPVRSIQLLFVIMVASLGGCVHVTSDWDPKADFKSLTTYAFTSPPKESPLMNAMYNDQLYRDRVQTAINQDLQDKGFTRASDGEAPTFRVAFFRVVDKKLSHDSVNTFMGYGGSTWYGGANHGADLGGDPVFGASTTVSQYTESMLFTDVMDSDGSLIWRGTGASRLSDPKRPDVAQQAVSKEITQILAKLPPGVTRSK